MILDDLLALLRGQVVKIKIEMEISLLPGQKTESPVQPTFQADCEYCSWSGQYSSQLSANRARAAHLSHCTGYAEQTDYIAAIQQSKRGT